MKILIFMSQFYQLCGAERLAVELAEELNKRGIYTDILTMYTEDLPGVKKAKDYILAKGIPTVHFLGMKIHPRVISMIPAILRLKRLLRKEKYDIIETSSVSPTVLAAWATMGLFTKHLAGLHQVFRRGRENSLDHRFWRFTVRCNPNIRFYGISNKVTSEWIKYSKIPPSRMMTVYNGISPAHFEVNPARVEVRRELGIPDQGKIILNVGQLIKYKGIDTLFESVSPILREKKCYLLYVGHLDADVSGSHELVQLLKKRVEAAGVQEYVKFLGYRKDVPRLMASSDVLVHPAQIEGFGLVLVEAMATGLQIVASNVDGIPEVLKGTDSIMVSPNDPEALRKAVLEVLGRTPEATAESIAKGYKRAENFRIERRTEEMIALFKDVLNGDF